MQDGKPRIGLTLLADHDGIIPNKSDYLGIFIL